jgi:hypothetical protein
MRCVLGSSSKIVAVTLAISDETNEHDMGGAGKEKPPGKADDKQGKPLPPPRDDDIEDGDIAKPKRDRNDEDDQSR